MQKKLIALAVAAAFSAPAFADVTAYGVVDAAVVHVSADGQRSDTQVVASGLAASRFGVKTVEDLNNGMKAVVVLEYAIDPQTNSSVGGTQMSVITAPKAFGLFAARQQMLAVAGDFGTFATGFLQTTGYDWAVKFDPTSGSSVSPLQSMTSGTNFLVGSNTLGARAQRALAYISPDLGGVTVALNYSTDTGLLPSGLGLGNLLVADTAGEKKVSATLLSATYTGGPLSVGGVYAKSSAPTGAEAYSLTDVALGASYDLSVVKLFGTYQTTKNDTANAQTDKALSFSAVAPVGPGAVLFSYAKSTLGSSTSGAGLNKNGSGYTVAYLQGLSKLTTAYASLSKVKNGTNGGQYSIDNNAPSITGMKVGGSSTMLAVGLSKKF